jgi:hypothetical protein
MHNGLFIGWHRPARGREMQATKVFGEFVEMLGAWKAKGQISMFMPTFLAPHGSDLGGFFFVMGEPAKLDQLLGGEEFNKAMTRAEICVDGMTVVRALTGDEIGKQMGLFQTQVAELTK